MHILVIILTIRKTIIVEVDSSDTIGDLKAKIRSREGIPPEQQFLIFASQKLENCKKLSDYNIQSHSLVYLAVRIRGGMQIFVKAVNGKTITLEVESTATINDLKRKIEEKEGIPSGMQKLLLGGKRLDDGGANLSDCNISSGSTLSLSEIF